MAVWGSTTTAMFSSGLFALTESMPQQVKESQSMDQQYFKRKDTTAIGNYSAFQSFSPCWPVPWQDLVSVWSGCHFMTAFASILIGLYFIFMTTEKSII
jgi:hypothetical protein